MQIRACSITRGEVPWENLNLRTFDEWSFRAPDYLMYFITYPALKDDDSVVTEKHVATTRYRIIHGCISGYSQAQKDPTDEVKEIIDNLDDPRQRGFHPLEDFGC